MNFTYLDYHEDLFSKIISNDLPRIYVFDNTNNMLKAREYYKKPLLQRGSIFITISDLKEKLFPTDRLILKEEKLAVIFYELLTEREKKELQISDYFDAIEFASEFF